MAVLVAMAVRVDMAVAFGLVSRSHGLLLWLSAVSHSELALHPCSAIPCSVPCEVSHAPLEVSHKCLMPPCSLRHPPALEALRQKRESEYLVRVVREEVRVLSWARVTVGIRVRVGMRVM